MKVETMEDLEEDNKLTITLPEEVAKRIGNRLSASFMEGEIVISEVKE
jgi:hypothetical protein